MNDDTFKELFSQSESKTCSDFLILWLSVYFINIFQTLQRPD